MSFKTVSGIAAIIFAGLLQVVVWAGEEQEPEDPKPALPKSSLAVIKERGVLNVGMMVDAMDRDEAYVAFDRDLVFLIYSRTDPERAQRFLLHPLADIMNKVGLLLRKNSDVTPVVQDFIEKRDEVQELSEIIDKYMKF